MLQDYHRLGKGPCNPLRTAGGLLAVGIAVMAAGGCAHGPNPSVLFPPEIDGWKLVGPIETYDAETLYDYIDGGAEVYRALNVERAFATRYTKDGGHEIIADVFDMGSSEDAYGAYHHDMREGRSAGIGRESEYMQGSLSFWQGRFFVSIIAFEETEDSRRAVLCLGEAFARELPDEGDPPEVVALLPEEGLLSGQVHYFHTHGTLNVHYFLADENLFNLNKDTEVVLARYGPRDAGPDTPPCVLLLIRYPSRGAATEALSRFLSAYLPDADAEGAVETENGMWTGVQISGKLIVGVFDAPSRDQVRKVIRGVTEQRARSRS